MIVDDAGREGGLLPGGYTLIEVVIAMLLLLIVSSGMLGAALAGRKSTGHTQRRAAAAEAIRRVAEALKSYWTADTASVAGPGDPTVANGWALAGDSCACWAFKTGVAHKLDAATWAPDLAGQGGAISYTVTTSTSALGPQPSVQFNVAWTETASQ